MKALKKLTALIVAFLLMIPINVSAEEHECIPVSSGDVTTEISSSEEWCTITMITETYTCECGAQWTSTHEEKIPHKFEIQTQTEHTTSDGDYCSIKTVTTTYVCQCGREKEETTVDSVAHEWELVCVDPIRNGYQRMCTKCGRTSGIVSYPTAIDDEKEEY